MTNVPAAVERTRLGLGLTQKAVAEALGVSQPHYSKVKCGEVAPSEALTERMRDWLKRAGPTRRRGFDQRARALSRAIERQSKELATLLASR